MEQCAGMLIGEDPFRIEYLWQMLFRGYFYPAGREKVHALGALDVALWDLKRESAWCACISTSRRNEPAARRMLFDRVARTRHAEGESKSLRRFGFSSVSNLH